MMDRRDMPTAGDYAMREAEVARQIAEGAAKADTASRAELERQVTVLRGQVAFLTGFVSELVDRADMWLSIDDTRLIEKIKENNW